MNALEFFRTSRPPLPHERLARWELRMGRYRAAERMRSACIVQRVDAYVSRHLHAPFQPRLPR